MVTGTNGFTFSGSQLLLFETATATTTGLTGTINVSPSNTATGLFVLRSTTAGAGVDFFSSSTTLNLAANSQVLAQPFTTSGARVNIKANFSGTGALILQGDQVTNPVVYVDGTTTGLTGSASDTRGIVLFTKGTINTIDLPAAVTFQSGSANVRTLSLNLSAPTTYATDVYLSGTNTTATGNVFASIGSAAVTLTGAIKKTAGAAENTLTLDGSTLVENTISGDAVVSAGSIALRKTGVTTWVLSGNNSAITGTVSVSGGVLRGTNANSFGSGASSITPAAGGTVELDGSFTLAKPFSSAAGTIRLRSGSSTLTGGIALAGSTTLEALTGTTLTISTLGLSSSGLVNLTAAGAGDIDIQSAIATINVSTLTKNDSGTLTLTNTANTFSGTPTINAGVLEVKALANSGSNSSLGAGTAIAFGAASTGVLKYSGTSLAATNRAVTLNTASGAGFDSSATASYASMTLSGSATLTGSNTIALKGSNTGYNTWAGTLTGSQSLNKTEAGRWILTGANDLTGTTTVSAGRLMAANSAYGNKLLGGTVVVQAGGEIHLGSENDQKGRCAYTNLTVGGTAGNRAKVRIGGAATNPTVYLNGDLALPTGSDKANWDLTGDTFKTPGTYTLFVFSGAFGVTGGTVASNVLATYPAGRFGVLAYNTGSPNTITVTIS